MPIYEYKCKSCGYVFDEFWMTFEEAEKFEPDYLTQRKCEKCGSTEKDRLLSSSTINFKGEGWTNRVIGPSKGRRDSTGNLKEHVDRIKEETKNLTSKDLYGDTSKI